MAVQLKCDKCRRKYYTAKSLRQVSESENICQECGGELKIMVDFSGEGKQDSSGDKVES